MHMCICCYMSMPIVLPYNTPSHTLMLSYSEKCEKWRKLPADVAPEDLPDVWYCSMNTWDVSLASCDAPEEAGADDDAEC